MTTGNEIELATAPAPAAPAQDLAPAVPQIDVTKLALGQNADNQAFKMIRLPDQEAEQIHEQAQGLFDKVLQGQPTTREFEDLITRIGNLGTKQMADIKASPIMDRPIKLLEDGGAIEKTKVPEKLSELSEILTNLNPRKEGNLLQPYRILGVIPYGTKLKRYIQRNRSVFSHMKEIVGNLNDCRDALIYDNAQLGEDQQQILSDMANLKKYILLAEALDTLLTNSLPKVEASDPELARMIKTKLLFNIRQQLMALYELLNLCYMGYLQFEQLKDLQTGVQKNVERVTVNGVFALNVALQVASNISNIERANKMIAATSAAVTAQVESNAAMLGQQVEIFTQQATNPMMEVERMSAAFDKTISSMEQLATFKEASLGNMRKTIEDMKALAAKGEQEVDRARNLNAEIHLDNEAAKPTPLSI